MTKNTTFLSLPQPSTVVGLGILAGTFCYLITGDPVWAGVAAAVVKILVPDNSVGGDQVFEAIAKLAQIAGRPLKTPTLQPPVPTGASGNGPSPLCQQVPKKMTADPMRNQG
jgi:hypothetical protein